MAAIQHYRQSAVTVIHRNPCTPQELHPCGPSQGGREEGCGRIYSQHPGSPDAGGTVKAGRGRLWKAVTPGTWRHVS
jgi:hypothetical protein